MTTNLAGLQGNPEVLPFASHYFTGIRASDSRLTVGNFVGGIQPILAMQDHERELDDVCRPLMFVADMHAFTDQAPDDIVVNRQEVLYSYLALGVDPEVTDLFVQSQIGDRVLRASMALSRMMTIRQIERVPTLKDKIDDTKTANMLLAQYPLMMAADIILQRPEVVPTGADQKSHIEVARDLVDGINRRTTSSHVPMPDTLELNPVNILALKGDGKMSKTKPDLAILLDESPEVIAHKIRRAQSGSPGQASPHLESLITVGKAVGDDESAAAMDALYAEHRGGEPVASLIKKLITDNMIEFTQQYQTRRAALVGNSSLGDYLKAGAQRAAANADETLAALDDGGITLPVYPS